MVASGDREYRIGVRAEPESVEGLADPQPLRGDRQLCAEPAGEEPAETRGEEYSGDSEGETADDGGGFDGEDENGADHGGSGEEDLWIALYHGFQG